MAILSIIFNPPGSFSVKPNVIYVVSNDTFAQVQAVGYLNGAVDTYGDIFANYYLAVVMTTDKGAVLFQIQVDGSNISLSTIGASNGVDISALTARVTALESSVATLTTQLAGKLNVTDVASVAQMEGASANNVYVSPLVVNRSPAVAKAWVSFTAAGVIESSYNIASVVKNSTGLWTITYTVPFSSSNYDPIFTAELTIASLLSVGVKAGTRAAGSIQVSSATLLGILADPSGKLYFMAFGDQ